MSGGERNIDRAMEGAALAPLSAHQRQRLAALGRWALTLREDAGLEAAGTDFDAWRHRHCLMVAERSGLRTARQEDYLPLRGHFLVLASEALGALGRPGAERLLRAAQRMREKVEHEPRSVAMAKLRAEMRGARDTIGNVEGYVAQIARCKFKTTDLGELSEKQLWVLVFDIRRSAQRRRKVGKGGGK